MAASGPAHTHTSDDEQLMQVAIQRSLTDQPEPVCHPNPANPPSESKSVNISRDVQHHMFSNDEETVIAWTRHNGNLQVTVQPLEDLDPFLSAMWRGDADALKDIIQFNSKALDETNKDGYLPLHESAYYGHSQCLQVLLQARPESVNKRTHKSQTALFLAVSRKHLACAQQLLEGGADPNLANSQAESPLYQACEKNCTEMVELLLRFGAWPTRASVQGGTPLHEAASHRNLRVCEMLLRAGAQLSARNIYGIDAPFTAAQSGATHVLEHLLREGADVDTQASDGATALFEASKIGHTAVVHLLLSKRADVNKANRAGLLPLHVAAQNGHDRIVAMLIARTNRAKVKRSGISPLHFAAERNQDEILEILIKVGYDVNDTLSSDWSKLHEDRRSTALYSAVANRNVEAAEMLLQAGADPNLDIFNPLLLAVRKGSLEMVKLLVQHGADVNARLPTHATAFPAVLLFCLRYAAMLKFLLDHGCDAPACFRCPYASAPHPPLKHRERGREALYGLSEESSQHCVQFCEVICAPLLRGSVASVLHTLLDYVGQVTLCSRVRDQLDSSADAASVRERLALPCSLMHVCRLKIRQVCRPSSVSALPLPARLLRFLTYQQQPL